MNEGGWAATTATGLVGFYGLMKFWLRKRQKPQPEWLTALHEEQSKARREHAAMREEMNALRERQEHDAKVQLALLTRIDTALATADLPSIQQQLSRHAGRLDRIEGHLERSSPFGHGISGSD